MKEWTLLAQLGHWVAQIQVEIDPEPVAKGHIKGPVKMPCQCPDTRLLSGLVSGDCAIFLGEEQTLT